jgi:hypothetical protein
LSVAETAATAVQRFVVSRADRAVVPLAEMAATADR